MRSSSALAAVATALLLVGCAQDDDGASSETPDDVVAPRDDAAAAPESPPPASGADASVRPTDPDSGPAVEPPTPTSDAAVEPPPPAADAGPDVEDETRYPVPDWTTDSPESAGLDAVRLDEAATIAEGDGSYCLLVIRHGVLVYERYFDGADVSQTHPSWSIAKSYSSTLVGIAIDRGEIRALEDSVADYVPEWRGTDREAITVRDLVSMTSGLQWSAFQDYITMAAFTSDQTSFATALPSTEAPGSNWRYHNGGVQMLEPLFRNATGMSIEQYAEANLWSRIGMHATWAHDGAGDPTPYANVLATCRDHARLGYLYLHHGRWAGAQVVSESWVNQATTPSQAFNRAYGYLFWLNGEAPAMDAMSAAWPGRMVPFAPPDLFAARGFGNQFIDVIPSLDMVVVRFGTDPAATFDLGQLAADSRFAKHDALLEPILRAVRH